MQIQEIQTFNEVLFWYSEEGFQIDANLIALSTNQGEEDLVHQRAISASIWNPFWENSG